MNKLYTAIVLYAAPFAVLAQDAPPDGWDMDKVVTAVVVAVIAFVGGYVLKGLHALEKFVAGTKTQADDAVLKAVKEQVAKWLSENPQAKK